MTRHGVSHAAATLTCTLASGLLVRQLDLHVPMLTSGVRTAARWLIDVGDLSWSQAAVSRLLVAVALAFVWGVAFAWRRRG